MLTKIQKEILDQLNPFIDGEDGESRKGSAQVYPVIHIHSSETYWCSRANTVLHVPEDLVGDWIINRLFAESCWKDIRDEEWVRAEYKEVKTRKWVPKGTLLST